MVHQKPKHLTHSFIVDGVFPNETHNFIFYVTFVFSLNGWEEETSRRKGNLGVGYGLTFTESSVRVNGVRSRSGQM